MFAACRTSSLRQIDTEDIVCATVAYADGAIGVIDATTTAYPGYRERIDLAGELGTAVLEAEGLEVHCLGREPLQVAGSSAGGGGADPMAFSHEPHRLLLEDFIDALKTGRAPICDAREGRRSVALIDAIYRSAQSGGFETP